MSERGVDAVWVGTFAGLNEGDMRGGWLELPYDEGSIGAWLRRVVGVGPDREEIGVFDADLCGPLGEMGVDVCEVARLEALNTLALLAGRLGDREMEAVRAYKAYEGPMGVVELGNIIAQAAEIPCRHLPGRAESYSSPEERLGYALVAELGGVEALSDGELEANFDYEAYGREMLSEGLYSIGRGIYVDIDASAPSTDLYRAEELADLACDQALKDPEAARKVLVGAGCTPRAVDDFTADNGVDALLAAASIVSSLPAEDLSALTLWAGNGCRPFGPLEAANAALDVDEIVRGELPGSPGSLEERMGLSLADHLGISRGQLAAHFDYERYGGDALRDGSIALCGESYLETNGDWPDMRRYDMGELKEMAARGTACPSSPGEAIRAPRPRGRKI